MDKASKSKRRWIDILLVSILLLIIYALVMPRIGGGSEARITAARADVSSFKTALQMFRVDTGFYPSTAQGLGALLQCPAGITNWHGPYLVPGHLPLDPWGHEYICEHSVNGAVETFAVVSYGSDGKPGGDDDISESWEVVKAKKGGN